MGGDGSILKSIVMVAQLSDYTKNHEIVHFKRENFMACELHFSRAVIKNK